MRDPFFGQARSQLTYIQLDTDLGGSVLRLPESLFGGAFGIQLPLMSGRGGVWFGAAACR